MSMVRSNSQDIAQVDLNLCPRIVTMIRGAVSINLETFIRNLSQCKKYKDRIEYWNTSCITKQFTLSNGTYLSEKVNINNIEEIIVMKAPQYLTEVLKV